MEQNQVPNIKNYYHLRGKLSPGSRMIAIGGGKGGVGKSFLSSNLAIFQANMGYNTILVDLDLGAANAHTVLGESLPNKGISDFLKTPEKPLEEFLAGTRFPNLRILSGANDDWDMANLNDSNRSRLMSAIYHYPADFIVLDLSAGTHKTTLDFFLMAQQRVVTLTPDPSSIENAYRFMKATFFRRIKRFELQMQVKDRIGDIMNQCNELGVKSPADLIKEIQRVDPVRGERFGQFMQLLNFNLVINQARSSRDADLGHSIRSVCVKYFGVNANLLGHLDYDNAVWQSLRKRKPLLLESPNSRIYAQLLKITRDLVHPGHKRKVG